MSSIKNVLIAYDGSRSADSAMDDLKNAGLAAEGINAVVMSVAEVWLPPEPMSDDDLPTEGMRQHLRANFEIFEQVKESNNAATERVRNLFPKWNVTGHVTSGSPAWEILAKATELKTDLIVMGAQGISAIDRILIGSVSGKIVNEAGCSVRVARGKINVDNGAPRIVVGFDGSDGAHAVIDEIIDRNWPAGTEIRVVVASDSSSPISYIDIKDVDIEDVTSSIIEKLKSSNIKAEKVIVEGSPKKVLIDEAQKWSADCIFVGAAGYSPRVARMLLGTASSAIVTRAHCSVEVVRPDSN
jgi:nucleotide-binding universal stress UspA family protein